MDEATKTGAAARGHVVVIGVGIIGATSALEALREKRADFLEWVKL